MLQVVQQAWDAFAAEVNRKAKAQLSQKLLALLIYTAITPGRCKEFMTLKFHIHNDCLPPLEATPLASTCIHMTAKGDAGEMVLDDYKTSSHHGCDRILLSANSPLLRHLTDHLQHHRPVSAAAVDHQYLFVVSGDEDMLACLQGIVHTHARTSHPRWELPTGPFHCFPELQRRAICGQ